MKRILITTTTALLFGCGQSATNMGGDGSGSSSSPYAPKPASLRVNLTDAPIDHVKEVNVNIKNMELWVEKGGKQARIIIGKDFGMLNFLNFQNGVLLPIEDLEIPNGVTITKIRLILDESNNHLIKDDDSRCDLHTPSGQQI